MERVNFIVRVGVTHLSPEHVVELDNRLTAFLSNEQPFLKPSYTLRQLADDTQIPLHHLSAFINQHYGLHFNDFINTYRIRHCTMKIQNKEWKQKKLQAIAGESGFNNRNTFTAAFKKVVGVNPSEYLKTMKAKAANVNLET
jgi:AraC-like DNA-binding protein